ncbi:MAG: hypothetical protein QOE70_1259 [Chthoniobacter sp.]|jgi:hypothetical protein|nr:hypothetical protein [Chthoniobacter sp.]
MKLTFLLPLCIAAVSALRADNEIGFIEKFALAPDREAVLGELIPGSEDYYFFHALHFQNSGQAAKLKAIMEQWANRFPNSDRRQVIENRAALLGYDASPQATLQFLRDRLHLEFNHEQEVRDRKPDLPTALDQARIARGVFQADALNSGDDLGRFSDAALEALVREKVALRPAQERALLARLKRPDLPGLVELVERDLRNKESRGFGEFPIHKLLLPEQLDDLATRIPALTGNQTFVFARLRKLLPGADGDADYDPAEREAWLERAWGYVAKLSPAFNTLKAQILFQRLQHDRTRGLYDKARFLEYLKLPRRTGYTNPSYVDQPQALGPAVDLNASFSGELATVLPIGNDEWLVREFLLQLLRDEDAWEPWTVWLRDTYVKPLFAEAKIVNGIGDPEQWASLLTPTAFQALKDRVDVDFAPANPPFLAPADDVALDLLIKNVPKLIVKIYEVNTLSYFLTQKRQLNTDLNVDGLVANKETTHDLAADQRSPFRRVARKFSFPELKGRRGAWVIEFIGGGKSSRALVRKGQWHLIQQTGPAGDMLTVLDEGFQPVKDAVVWVDGRKLTPDAKSGQIVVPFTNQPGTKPIILADAAGEFATLTQFEHHGEQYKLDAQFHLEREQLLGGREATLAVRTALLLGNAQVPLELLQETRLTLTTTTLDGVATTKEIKGVKLDPAKVFTHRFPVPERLASVAVTLSAKIENLSAGGQKQDLQASGSFALNGIDKREFVMDGHFSKFGDGYVFELLGKNGEALADQVLTFRFQHHDFSNEVGVSLSTDGKGRVTLGALDAIRRIQATLPNGLVGNWTIDESGAVRPQALHGTTGDVFRVPWMGEGLQPERVSLLEKRGETFVKDHFAALSLAHGFLEIKGLPPGDYSLLLRDEGAEITIRVTAGAAVRNWLLSPNRHLEVRNAAPVQIESVRAAADVVAIQLRNVNPFTRLHVAAARFVPSDLRISNLAGFDRFNPALSEPSRRPNLFVAGRAIGDEYRYILERRYAKTYPGNMLTRPGLLLNPWEVRSTDLEAQVTATSEALKRSAGDRENKAMGGQKAGGITDFDRTGPAGENQSNLDFLATAAPVLYNLVPDQDGIVRLDRKALGDRQYIQLYAEDLSSAVWRTLALPEVPTKFQDLRLVRGLDPAKPFAEKKEATVLGTGQSITLADLLTSELETYDSLAAIHSLLSTLNGDANFAKFAFILQWPKLKDEEKRAKYSEFACHELSFFLSRKDPDFFAKVVQPYLRNKKDKTFLDEYLIGADLRLHLEPWAYARLNVVERALLAQRLPGEAAAAARHLRELWELLPPDPERQDKLFETALRGRALAEEEGEFRREKGKAETLADKSALATDHPAPVGAMGGALAAASASTAAPHPRLAPAREGVGRRDAAEKATPELAFESNRAGSLGDADAKKQSTALGVVVNEPMPSDYAFYAMDGERAVQLRSAVRQYFRPIGPTKEWAENNYYQLRIAQQQADLVTINAFWRDFAAWNGKAPFLSPHIAEASRNFTEMMLALAVLDLPFEPAKHATKSDAGAFTLTAGSPVIAYHKQIKPTEPAAAAGGTELLVSQNFYRHGDRYREEGNEKFDKYVTTEFLSGVVYGANVVVTNPGSSPQKIEVLLQIPRGALPVLGSKATDSRRLRLEPYTTQTFEYYFYFPAPSAQPFLHYPVHVSRNERVVGAAKPFTFKVVKQLSEIDKTSWDYLSQDGTDDEVFAFLEQHNAARLNFEKVAWRARQSAEFFRKITALLAKLHLWSEPIYRYAIQHNDAPTLREWLRHRDDFLAQCGPFLDSKLLVIDPIERRAYEHLEYSPLINQRAHRIGAENKIPNPVFRGQYQNLLNILAHKPALDAMDSMSVVYYLFLQDRAEEALARFHEIKAEALPTRLQHDYFRCYAAFYEEQMASARQIAAGYADHPVDRWRKLFAEVTAQLDEIENKAVARAGDDQPNREKQQAELAASEPAMDFKVENRSIALTWKNLREVTIKYYLMDPEFLFSASPFVTQDPGRFSIIKPTQSAPQALPEGKDTLDIPLPAAFAKANVLVEILGAGQRKAQAYHANTLQLALAENYGRFELRDSAAGQPVSEAYVKVYARLKNGAVRFFKDGYTDLRGKFDYASLNSSDRAGSPRPIAQDARGGASGLDYPMLAPRELNEVDRLAILILSEAHGAMVREVGPPSQ